MEYREVIRALLILAPIVMLLLIGLSLTLRSGVASLTTHQGLRQLASNLSALFLKMVVYAAGLFAAHHIVGFRVSGW